MSLILILFLQYATVNPRLRRCRRCCRGHTTDRQTLQASATVEVPTAAAAAEAAATPGHQVVRSSSP